MPTIGGISWFMLFYEKCNGPLVGTYNIWLEVSLKFPVDLSTGQGEFASATHSIKVALLYLSTLNPN